MKINGQTVFQARAAFYDSTLQQITIGENLIRGTTCNPAFTGSIISHAQEWPLPPPP